MDSYTIQPHPPKALIHVLCACSIQVGYNHYRKGTMRKQNGLGTRLAWQKSRPRNGVGSRNGYAPRLWQNMSFFFSRLFFSFSLFFLSFSFFFSFFLFSFFLSFFPLIFSFLNNSLLFLHFYNIFISSDRIFLLPAFARFGILHSRTVVTLQP